MFQTKINIASVTCSTPPRLSRRTQQVFAGGAGSVKGACAHGLGPRGSRASQGARALGPKWGHAHPQRAHGPAPKWPTAPLKRARGHAPHGPYSRYLQIRNAHVAYVSNTPLSVCQHSQKNKNLTNFRRALIIGFIF